MNQKNVSVINIQSNYSQNNCKQKPAECSDQNEVSKKEKRERKTLDNERNNTCLLFDHD